MLAWRIKHQHNIVFSSRTDTKNYTITMAHSLKDNICEEINRRVLSIQSHVVSGCELCFSYHECDVYYIFTS